MKLSKVIEDLRAVGLSEKRIAELVDTSQPTIHRIRTGESSDTSYRVGKALEKLHKAHYPPEGYTTPPEPVERRSGQDRRQSGCRRADQSPGRRQGDDRRAAADRRREETDAA